MSHLYDSNAVYMTLYAVYIYSTAGKTIEMENGLYIKNNAMNSI